MGSAARLHTAPRPRPVAGAPVESLVARADELARRWAIALIVARPLEALGELPLETFAREAPPLCAQVVRALSSDEQLEQICVPSSREDRAALPALRLAEVTGARDSTAVVEAVEALRGVLWEALLAASGQLTDDGRRAADAGDRLAFVCACALSLALEGGEAPLTTRRFPLGAAPDELGAAAGHGAGAVIVDEQQAADPAARRSPVTFAAEPVTFAAEPVAEAAEIAARDHRREAGPAAWIGSLGRELERFGRDGQPFAVLLLEIPALARPARGGSPALAARVEQALLNELRVGGRGWRGERLPGPHALTRERAGRYWLVAPQLDRGGAELLAEGLARAITGTAEDGGLELVAGVAVCPEDGRDAAGLAAHADIELYAARRAR
jgi:GGDEF domain-containing protein